MESVGFISAVIYTGILLIAAGLFLVATLAGEYTLVERLGGVGWVFLLSMIVLMPIITPLVKRKLGGGSTSRNDTSFLYRGQVAPNLVPCFTNDLYQKKLQGKEIRE